MNTPEKLFLSLARAIVGEEPAIQLEAVEFRGRRILNVHVPIEFHGRVIGKGGSVVEAIRLLLVLASRRSGVQSSLRIHAPEKRYEGQFQPFTPNLNWNSSWLLELMNGLAHECFLKPVQVAVCDCDNGWTDVLFTLDGSEQNREMDAQINSSMTELLKAIGMGNGRKIRFSMQRA